MRTWLCLGVLGTSVGCTVEDVIVDTGGGDTGVDEGPRDVPDRNDPGGTAPGADPADDPVDDPSDEPVGALTLVPDEVLAGTHALVFVEAPAGSGALADVAAVQLYGEPDATLQTWTADGPDRLVLAVEVPASSPLGDLLVVVEHDDGSVTRPDGPLTVR